MPFGEAVSITETIVNNLRFPGQYFDAETGLSYNYFRDYNPQIGRYVETDPIGLMSGMNLYQYAGANPVKYVDPSGLSEIIGAGFDAEAHFIGGFGFSTNICCDGKNRWRVIAPVFKQSNQAA